MKTLEEIMAETEAVMVKSGAFDAGPVRDDDASGDDEATRLAACQARVLATVPKGYRWARPGVPELAARVVGYTPDLVPKLARAHRAVIIGPAGSGKTSLACAAFALFVETRKWSANRAMFVHAYRLASARAQYKLGDGDAPLVEQAMRAPLIVLDDLGNERRTELSAVPDVIFERHAEERASWITTPFSAEQVAQKYGDGIARRAFERAVVVRLGKREAAA